MPSVKLGWFAIALASLALAACDDCSRRVAPTPASASADASALHISHADSDFWPASGAGKHPGLLLLHGAGGPELFNDTHSSHHHYPVYFAEHGYAVFMPHLPGSGDGLPVARVALETLARRDDIDGIAVVGFSRGGFVALRLASVEPRVVALVELYGFLRDADAEKIVRMPPTLILHGEKDPEVKLAEAIKLEQLFRAKHFDFERHYYPNEEHGFKADARVDSSRRAVEFLDAHFRARRE